MDVSKRKALVVEDNQLHCDLVASIVESLGFCVFTAADGDTGLEIIKSEGDIELVVTDIFMPKKEGIGFIRAVRRRQQKVKIVAVTGAVNFNTISDTALQFGADLIIKKPIDSEEFALQLNNLLQLQG